MATILSTIVWIIIFILIIRDYRNNKAMREINKSETGSISTASTMSTLTSEGTTSSSTRSRNRNTRWGNKPNTVSTIVDTFKGTNASLKGKVFTIGANQASQYDDTFKSLLVYIADKFDHRVHTAIKSKNKDTGLKLLTRPSAPTKEDPNNNSKTVLDRECEEFIEYQIEIKKYVDRKNKLDDDIQQIFNIVYGQCSPGMQQKLE